MAIFDQLEPASFDGLSFPIRSCRITGQYRLYEHQYLKTPGALIEPLGRSNYRIEMRSPFDVNVEGFTNLWPTTLAALRTRFEKGKTAPLVIPTIGTIQAIQPEWDQLFEAKIRSGEEVVLHFLESSTEETIASALSAIDEGSLSATALNLDAIQKSLIPGTPSQNIFDQIQNAVNGVLAIKDQADLYGARVTAQVGALTQLIQQCDRGVAELQQPVNYPLIDALHQLLESVVDVGNTLLERGLEPRIFIVPRTMSVSAISTEIYGDATHAVDIMQNNQLFDPFNVPAGTEILYYVNTQAAAA